MPNSNRKTIQKVELLNKVENTSILSASTTLQFTMLNKFIKMKVWKQMVSRTSLLVGLPVSFLKGSVIGLKASSKKMKLPAYIRKIMTKIWYRDWIRTCLQISGRRILSLLLILLDLPYLMLYGSVPIAIAPRISIIKLVQSIWTTLRGLWPTVHPPRMVILQMTMLTVS